MSVKMAGGPILSCALLFAMFSVSHAASTCFVANSYYESCEYGCCGDSPYEECCDNIVGLIVGLTVAFIVIVLIIIVVVCVIMHYKNNQVVRMVNSATSARNNANITILHMSSDNPYQSVPRQPGHMTMAQHATQYPNQPSFAQPAVQFGFQPDGYRSNPAPGFPAPPSPGLDGSNCDPAYPPAAKRPLPGGSALMPAASDAGGVGKGTSTTPRGGPGMTSSSTTNGSPWMTSSSMLNGGPGLTSSSVTNGDSSVTSSSTTNGGRRALSPVKPKNGVSPMTSNVFTPRKNPLPVIPVAAGVSTPEPAPQVITAFGAPSKTGARSKEPTSLGVKPTVKTTTDDSGNIGVEDIEDFD